MRIGVIRGDLPQPIFLADVEPTSQTNFPVDPPGQTQYLEYPDTTSLTNFLAGVYASDSLDGSPAITIPIPAGKTGAGGVPAGIEGSSAVTFPLTVNGSNNVIRVQLVSAGPFTAVTITAATYNTMASLLTAVNAALVAAGVAASATTDTATGTLFVLQSTAVGVGAYIGVDTVGNGSTFNTPANLADGQHFTMPSAATIIAALLPVGGPLNVSAASLLTNVGAAPAAANVANVIAPLLTETEVVLKSFLVGNIAGYLLPNYTPDPHRVPALALGAAITVVQNDGTSLFSYPYPSISGAVHNTPNTGDITISGTNMANSEFFNATVVHVASGAGVIPATSVRLEQKLIAHSVLLAGTFNVVNGSANVIATSPQTFAANAVVSFSSQPGTYYLVQTAVANSTTFTLTANYTGPTDVSASATPGTVGSVSATSIVLPAALLNGLGVVGSIVGLSFSSIPNGVAGTAATIASLSGTGLATLTGLTGAGLTSSSVGSYVKLTGAAVAGNNGAYLITSVASATSCVIANPNAFLPDANNGSIHWVTYPVGFVVT